MIIEAVNKEIQKSLQRALRMRPVPSKNDDENNLFLCSQYYRFNPFDKITEAPPVLQINDTGEIFRALTKGNLSVVSGKQKSRKSMFVSMIASAVTSGQEIDGKLKPNDDENGVVLYFDTEQSTGDIRRVFQRIIDKSSMTTEQAYKKLLMYELKGLSPSEMILMIEEIISEIIEDDIALVIIDGIADINPNFNDLDEAANTVGKIQSLCKHYDCHILNVIHTGKSNGFTKGHLGSLLDQKCETHFNLKADGDTSTIEPLATRGKAFNSFALSFDDVNKVPFVLQNYTPKIEADKVKKVSFFDLTDDVHFEILSKAFKNNKEYTSQEVISKLKEQLHNKDLACGDSKAKEAKQFYTTNKGWIEKSGKDHSKAVRYIFNYRSIKLNGITYDTENSRWLVG